MFLFYPLIRRKVIEYEYNPGTTPRSQRKDWIYPIPQFSPSGLRPGHRLDPDDLDDDPYHPSKSRHI